MKIETDTLGGLFVGWVGFVYLKFFFVGLICDYDIELIKNSKNSTRSD